MYWCLTLTTISLTRLFPALFSICSPEAAYDLIWAQASKASGASRSQSTCFRAPRFPLPCYLHNSNAGFLCYMFRMHELAYIFQCSGAVRASGASLKQQPRCDHLRLDNNRFLSLNARSHPSCCRRLETQITITDILYSLHCERGSVMRSSPKYAKSTDALVRASMCKTPRHDHPVKALW